MPRSTGSIITTTTSGDSVRAFVPSPLPSDAPPVASESYAAANRAAELALARLNGVSGFGSVGRLAPVRRCAQGGTTDLADRGHARPRSMTCSRTRPGLKWTMPTMWRK